MMCPRYSALRDRYILPEHREGQNHCENLVKLLNCTDKRALDNLGVYIRKALKVHQKYAEALLYLIGDTVDLTGISQHR